MPTAITVTNQEWTILSGVDTAMTAAQISGVNAFGSVTVTASAEQARECQYKGTTPIAVIRYVGTDETHTIEGESMAVVSVELRLATKKDRGVDESNAVQEALRLVNAAKNAIGAASISGNYAVGTDSPFAYQIAYDSPTIDTAAGDSAKPWITAILPVKFGFYIDSSTAH